MRASQVHLAYLSRRAEQAEAERDSALEANTKLREALYRARKRARLAEEKLAESKTTVGELRKTNLALHKKARDKEITYIGRIASTRLDTIRATKQQKQTETAVAKMLTERDKDAATITALRSTIKELEGAARGRKLRATA